MAIHQALQHIVAGTSYLVHPQVLGTVIDPVVPNDIVPVVIISAEVTEITTQSIDDHLALFAKIDDVHQKEFDANLVLMSSTEAKVNRMTEILRSNASSRFTSIYQAVAPSSNLLPSGPYFLRGSEIHQAWRLYPDDLDAFIFAAVPEDVHSRQRYNVVQALTPDGIWRHIPVPSRLYARPSPELPLAGARIAVKDIYKLAGVKTTMMSRHYIELYAADEENADYVSRLIELGATIIGKTKMTSFASSEEPTDQWIDFHCPINPRGDRYQSPGGSSSGAAAALAGYAWLDFSVGSDSAGSIRAPATFNGLFSLRPSVKSTSMTGIAINSPEFDVIEQFSRTLDDLYHIVSNTLDLSPKWTKFPSKILYPLDFFPHSNTKHQAMVDEFISVLEKFLGTKRVEFSIAERWAQCPPAAANKKTLEEYLAKSAFWSLCRDYNKIFEDYRNDYRKEFGSDAYAGAVVNFRWDLGNKVTDAEYTQYLNELTVFREWFNENVMSTDPDSLSDAIMIMPYGSANPKYRDSPNEAPFTFGTIGEKFMSPILHMPQLVLPFGQMPYKSRISGNTEHHPIASTLMGAKGSDLMLIKLAESAFEAAFWPTQIATGRYMYTLDGNLRNVRSVSSDNVRILSEKGQSEGRSGSVETLD